MRNIVDPVTNEIDLQLVGEALVQFKKDTLYADGHREEWTREYPNHWVIVFNEELVSVAPSLKEAMAKAESMGVPCNLAASELLITEDFDLIL